jgi:hypothetical protein
MTPAPDRPWPCGHPRVPENTTPGGRTGLGQCRSCKIARQRWRYVNDPEYRERQWVRGRRWYDGLDGVAYNGFLLRTRRSKALARRRKREMEVK